MNFKIRVVLTVSALMLGAANSSPAFAWGCVAVSENGTYGYSYNFYKGRPAFRSLPLSA